MNEVRIIETTKNDFKDLESFLLKSDLLDEKHIWFAGYDNYRKSTQNPIAGNLLYGNKRLIVISINGNDINYLSNSKKGFRLNIIGTLDKKHKVSSLRHIMYPVVDITVNSGEFYSIKVIKNKETIKDFKKNLKSI